ncbi:MAG: glycoside hydrolase family 19 protein [Elusimicrobiota bacterium]
MNKESLYNEVKKMFHPLAHKNIDKYLETVIMALHEFDLDYKEMVLMALATIKAETGKFAPIKEYVSKWNTTRGGRHFNKYDNRSDLGNLGPPDGALFPGRGFIQLTGRHNYKIHGRKIGVDLISNPDLANEPMTAARLLASFLKDAEQKIINALSYGDLRKARRLVNGGSHGLDDFTTAYHIGENLLPEGDNYYVKIFEGINNGSENTGSKHEQILPIAGSNIDDPGIDNTGVLGSVSPERSGGNNNRISWGPVFSLCIELFRKLKKIIGG